MNFPIPYYDEIPFAGWPPILPRPPGRRIDRQERERTMILRLFRGTPTVPPERLYGEIVAQARQPWLYSTAGVPDTVDGRFDMIVLHAFLVFDRLSGGDERAKTLSQAVFDEMFKDMDRSLREMGASDVGVGPKVRRMAEVFYGRSQAYSDALRQQGESRRQALIAALARNVFAGNEGAEPAGLADYVLEEHHGLAERPLEQLLSGHAGFRAKALSPA
jgi:cytochrome b pre-mRNA-processing protein 3